MADFDLIIIGGGPAGLTAGLYAARANMNAVLFEGKDVGGEISLRDPARECFVRRLDSAQHPPHRSHPRGDRIPPTSNGSSAAAQAACAAAEGWSRSGAVIPAPICWRISGEMSR